MVATGARVAVLRELLMRLGHSIATSSPTAPRLGSLPAEGAGAILELYRSLGGRHEHPPLKPGGWDLALAGGSIVELDEELHFNRYRGMTLEPTWAHQLPWGRDYVRFAVKREPECLAAGKWGKRWTNPSAEAMLGPSGAPGQLGGGGAARWKQRVLYDAMKDAAAAAGLPLIRLSVWDEAGGVLLGDVLERKAAPNLNALAELFDRRRS